jgi:hypothetical protein
MKDIKIIVAGEVNQVMRGEAERASVTVTFGERLAGVILKLGGYVVGIPGGLGWVVALALSMGALGWARPFPVAFLSVLAVSILFWQLGRVMILFGSYLAEPGDRVSSRQFAAHLVEHCATGAGGMACLPLGLAGCIGLVGDDLAGGIAALAVAAVCGCAVPRLARSWARRVVHLEP